MTFEESIGHAARAIRSHRQRSALTMLGIMIGLYTGGNPVPLAVGGLAGMVTAGLEIWLRRPTVGDFNRLKTDTARWKGWWTNRVSRVLLVFLFSTLGSAIGTYLAGFRILGRLSGG